MPGDVPSRDAPPRPFPHTPYDGPRASTHDTSSAPVREASRRPEPPHSAHGSTYDAGSMDAAEWDAVRRNPGGDTGGRGAWAGSGPRGDAGDAYDSRPGTAYTAATNASLDNMSDVWRLLDTPTGFAPEPERPGPAAPRARDDSDNDRDDGNYDRDYGEGLALQGVPVEIGTRPRPPAAHTAHTTSHTAPGTAAAGGLSAGGPGPASQAPRRAIRNYNEPDT